MALRGLTNPVGPESPRTYWVRRLVLLIALVAVIALMVAGISRLMSGPKKSATPAVPSLTPNPSWTDTAWGPGTATRSGSAGPSTSASPGKSRRASAASASTSSSRSASRVGELCEGSQLVVKVTGDTKKPKVGDTETFTVEVKSSADCRWDTQKVKQALTVTSGTDRIWSTEDCGSWGPKGVHEIKSKEPWTYEVSWPTKRSTGKCKLSKDDLGSGYYIATVGIDGGSSDRFIMQMSD